MPVPIGPSINPIRMVRPMSTVSTFSACVARASCSAARPCASTSACSRRMRFTVASAYTRARMSSNREDVVAGGGLLHRRLFLAQTAGLAGVTLLRAQPAAAQQDVPGWIKAPGQPLSGYGDRSPYEKAERLVAPVPGTTGSGSSRTPLEQLEGIITPSSLHFERHHSGIPDIPPAGHRL